MNRGEEVVYLVFVAVMIRNQPVDDPVQVAMPDLVQSK